MIVNLRPDNRGPPPGLAGPPEERLWIMPAVVVTGARQSAGAPWPKNWRRVTGVSSRRTISMCSTRRSSGSPPMHRRRRGGSRRGRPGGRILHRGRGWAARPARPAGRSGQPVSLPVGRGKPGSVLGWRRCLLCPRPWLSSGCLINRGGGSIGGCVVICLLWSAACGLCLPGRPAILREVAGE